ncbi:MAG: hypothetical protein JW969_16480 [Spirochaetales bacterium]|nr:hypothetical protein [Spirochaetales bacterium]
MIERLLKEYELEIDDIRWYLSKQMALKFLEYSRQVHALTHYVWSGKLEKELYNMEEVYLAELKEDLERELIDESHVRGIFSEIRHEKSKRRRPF